MRPKEFESTPEFEHFKKVMRGVLAVSKKRLDELVEAARKNSPRNGNPHVPGQKPAVNAAHHVRRNQPRTINSTASTAASLAPSPLFPRLLMKGTKKARRRIGFGLGKFEVVAAFAGLTVVFGIWIESRAEIRWAFKHHVWIPQAIGAILIALGVFAEVIITALAAREARRADLDAEERIATASTRVAEINERAANAERAAAEANELAEQERLARVKIETGLLKQGPRAALLQGPQRRQRFVNRRITPD
jgi:hypothetical protein